MSGHVAYYTPLHCSTPLVTFAIAAGQWIVALPHSSAAPPLITFAVAARQRIIALVYCGALRNDDGPNLFLARLGSTPDRP